MHPLPKKKFITKFLGFCIFLISYILLSDTFSQASSLNVIEVVTDVYMVEKINQDLMEKTAGGIANAGFIIGSEGVIVIDSGMSHQTGKALVKTIRTLTDLPIELTILTHADQNFIFGASALSLEGSSIGAHSLAARTMRERCQTCLEQLFETYGNKMLKSRVLVPDITWNQTTTLSVGGEKVKILYPGPMKTPGSIMIYHVNSSTLFSGGNVSHNHVPDVTKSDVSFWLASLETLDAMPINHVVPGYGPLGDHTSVDHTKEYLSHLTAEIEKYFFEAKTLIDTIALAKLPEFSQWSGYQQNHAKNVQEIYLQIELRQFR